MKRIDGERENETDGKGGSRNGEKRDSQIVEWGAGRKDIQREGRSDGKERKTRKGEGLSGRGV